MGAAGDERAAAPPPKAVRRRRLAVARPRAAEEVVYCMNEAELVDVALAVLAEHLQCEESEEKTQSWSHGEQEFQQTPNKAPGSTASIGAGSDHSLALPCPPDTGADANAERTDCEDSEDDVLKYVREIFFS
ncbi:modulator of retrovirus infection-like protein [Patagioenas fasciata monilis]|uniref:Modulator of retrovirus infection-like protein n=1 Tax=Patagioenas fasciata monilis TaxID=372326 RepID=A0A1V4JA22_PATFA|nr:modulator of retrovirus infection-like protein [Patagioenas fasciata monilis]